MIILYSSTSGNSVYNSNLLKIEHIFNTKNIPFDKIDGAADENVEIREFLFRLSGVRKYPLVFKYDENEKFKFIGDYEEIEYLVDQYAL